MPSQRAKALSALRRALQLRNIQNSTYRALYHFTEDTASQSNSDRAAALIVGSILEEALEIAICSHFKGWYDLDSAQKDQQRNSLFGHGASEISPLNSFAGRTRIGFALGIYGPDMNEDLDTIKNIRNLFAHFKGPVTFDVDEIATLCNGMKMLPKIEQGGGTLLFGGVPATPKGKFIRVSQSICLYLLMGLGEDEPLVYKGSDWEFIAS